MDEMNIESSFTTKLVSKAIHTIIRKKLGYDIDILLNKLNVKIADGKTHIHIDADAELSRDELTKIIKSVGLG
ncbi:MAG: CTP synthase [Clostridiales bacterium]|nr:CTP synthase [Clostridiales bacterium]